MIKRIKAYFAQKKQMRELALDSLQKLNSMITTFSELTDSIVAVIDAFNADGINQLQNERDAQ